ATQTLFIHYQHVSHPGAREVKRQAGAHHPRPNDDRFCCLWHNCPPCADAHACATGDSSMTPNTLHSVPGTLSGVKRSQKYIVSHSYIKEAYPVLSCRYSGLLMEEPFF